MSTPVNTSLTDSQMHNNIMAAVRAKDRSTNAWTRKIFLNGYAYGSNLQYNNIQQLKNSIEHEVQETKNTFSVGKRAIFLAFNWVKSLNVNKIKDQSVSGILESLLSMMENPMESVLLKPFYKLDEVSLTRNNLQGPVGNQRTMTVVGARETEAKAEQGVPLQAEQADWLANTNEEIDEQELEAHYSFMAKIQEVLPGESSSTEQPLE
ncbi:hypothetical protein Tco_1035883 [Tanacetum coccineum]